MRIRIIFPWLPILFLLACTALGPLQTPDVTLSNIETGRGMTLFEQRYDVTLRIQNPNNADLKLSGLSYAVTLNDQEFARGVSNERTVIPALGEKLVHVTMTSSPLDWINQINQLQANPELSPSYSVSGVLYLEGFTGRELPFSKAGKFVPDQ
jgi:LEA14-like dessication related protein